MKAIFKCIAIVAVATISIIACSTEEVIEPEVPAAPEEKPTPTTPEAKDTVTLLSSVLVSRSNWSSYGAEYKINRDADGGITSITYENVADGERFNLQTTTFTRTGNIIKMVNAGPYSYEESYSFDTDSLIAAIDYDGVDAPEISYEISNGLVLKGTNSNGWMDVVAYDGDVLTGINQYNAEGELNRQYSFDVNASKANPFRKIKDLELLLILLKFELTNGVLFSKYEVTETHVDDGDWQNFDYSYEFDRKGNLTKVNRTDNKETEEQYQQNSNLAFGYVAVAK